MSIFRISCSPARTRASSGGGSEGNGSAESLAIVDYKTAADGHTSHDFQLQVYTDAGRREGLDVSAAYVHDLKNTKRLKVDVEPDDIAAAEAKVNLLVTGLRSKEYPAKLP